MRILYHSAAPWIQTGYGECTEEIAGRLHNAGHEIAIQTMDSVRNKPIWWHGDELSYELDRPIRVYPSNDKLGVENVPDHFEDFNGDLYFTHFDTWLGPIEKIIPQFDIPYSSYVIVDHNPAPDSVVNQVSNAYETVAMSEFAQVKLEEKGIRSRVIPHGVDTDVYKPLSETDEGRARAIEVRDNENNLEEINLDDIFLFGMVAANLGSRKNIPNHIEAFKQFLDEVDDNARLYLHTDINRSQGYMLTDIIEDLGIPEENVIYARNEDYGEVSDEYLNSWYNAMDVLINCSMGESWGLTITEAMAAETPSIVTNFSSMPEQLGVDPRNPNDNIEWNENIGLAPHGIVIEPDGHLWKERVSARQYFVNPDSIFEAMKFYYNNQDLINEHGMKARQYVLDNYDWDKHIIPEFIDMFNELEVILG